MLLADNFLKYILKKELIDSLCEHNPIFTGEALMTLPNFIWRINLI
jgi:hypothetical protein